MKLQQLRFLSAIAKHNLNISAAAEKLYTSQPGVSKQIKMLEEELGIQLFSRNGKHLTHITPVGEKIIDIADVILKEVGNIKSLADEQRNHTKGCLTLATTHTQARYVLPEVIKKFVTEFPHVRLNLVQGSPEHIAKMAVSGEADFAIATESIATHNDLVQMPAYEWNRCIVVPKGHELTFAKRISLEALCEYPMVTYVKGLTGRDAMDKVFAEQGLQPDLVFTATDADVIKTYVRSGLGIGLIAHQAYQAQQDSDLVAIDVGHLFEPSTTRIGFRRGIYMRKFMQRFVALFAPHIDFNRLCDVEACANNKEVQALFEAVEIPKK